MERSGSTTQFAIRMFGSLLVGGTFSYLALGMWTEGQDYQIALPVALLMSAAGLVMVRMGLLAGLQMGWLTHRILVLGTGPEAAAVERSVREHSGSSVQITGFFPLTNGAASAVDAGRIVRNHASLERAIDALDVHEVVVAVQDQRGGFLPVKELLACRLRGIRVTDMPGLFERVTGEVPVQSLKASWLIYGEGFRQGLVRRILKRALDLAAALVLLVVAAPVMLAAAIAIFIECGGPVIFRQERVGLGGRTFNVLKFRSMCADAEKDGVPRWASTKDPRVTRVGRFIRKTRIDELPQIFNVLKGEMSFVGPRPERPYFVDQLSEQVPFYGARHTVKPGVTGWAQVRYSYGSTVEDAVRKLQFDLYYVKNHSVLLDVVILFRTVRVVLLGEGAR
jgi:sugar transferase (PEP-CTERM system associated)